MRPRVIVTCGPACAPIDRVRRITNFSTGELGLLLANRLSAAGCDVLCLKGEGATCAIPLEHGELRLFLTNDDLRAHLEEARREPVTAVFHAAALADFRVKSIAGTAPAAKLSSAAPEVTLTLDPVPKLISSLRALFPDALLAGWKYELDGTRDDALTRARAQIAAARTDLCVVNGAAWGAGFGVCEPGGAVHPCADKPALCEWLARWLSARCFSQTGR